VKTKEESMAGTFDAREFLMERLEAVAVGKPLIHHITNQVVMNETANLTLCLGALPVMAHAIEEAAEMAAQAHALVLNMGTPYPELVEAMIEAGRAANAAGVPVVFDPVGAGATGYRTEVAKSIMDEVRFAAVRGNAAEIATLSGQAAEIRGVESLAVGADAEEIGRRAAQQLGCVAAVTGAVDVVADGKRVARVSNGHPIMCGVTGTGCMATTTVAVLLASGEPYLEATAAALGLFGLCGEMAAGASGARPGSFHVELYNSAYSLAQLGKLDGLKVELAD
jgi:hydroxyethylthiazole kinase